MPLDPLLIEILVDPEDKQTLWYIEGEEILYNPRLRRKYRVRDGIPDMLISDAESVDGATHAGYDEQVRVETGHGSSNRGDL